MALTEAESKLIEAAHYKSIGGVRFFLKRGVSPNCQDPAGWTPLHWAASKGAEEVAEALLEAGADPSALSRDGEAPLHVAARLGEVGIQRLLIKKGADIRAKNKEGLTAVELAKRFRDANGLS